MPQSEAITFTCGEISLELTIPPDVFIPTHTTRLLGEVLLEQDLARVLDLGCGCGVLGLLAAKAGAGNVLCADVLQVAVLAAEENAKRNGLQSRMKFQCGSLYEAVPNQRFTCIVDDVSGVADRIARVTTWFRNDIPTGGEDGAELVIKVLEAAPQHLASPGGSIIFPVLSLSNQARILDAAHKAFANNVKPIASRTFPFSRELYNNMEIIDVLEQLGYVKTFRRGGRRFWTLDIYMAWV